MTLSKEIRRKKSAFRNHNFIMYRMKDIYWMDIHQLSDWADGVNISLPNPQAVLYIPNYFSMPYELSWVDLHHFNKHLADFTADHDTKRKPCENGTTVRVYHTLAGCHDKEHLSGKSCQSRKNKRRTSAVNKWEWKHVHDIFLGPLSNLTARGHICLSLSLSLCVCVYEGVCMHSSKAGEWKAASFNWVHKTDGWQNAHSV